jgi:hypothetical protein
MSAVECVPELLLAAGLGFVAGVLWQEFHFRKITRDLEELAKHLQSKGEN